MVLDRFSPATREWFEGAFAAPTPAQLGAWDAVSTGSHALVVAPTGSGKTLAAFLWSIDRMISAPGASTRVLYVSPLKALGVDVERNLRAPLVGVTQTAKRLGLPAPGVTVGVRSGDTTPADRRLLARTPPDILITTPESLYLMLTSAARETLAGVETVIIDEVHAVAATKRGAHLAVSLERLDELLPKPAQRIGLSATVRPLEEVARFLGGRAPVTIVQPPAAKTFDLSVVVPVEDMREPGVFARADGYAPVEAPPSGTSSESTGSIWPHVEERIVDEILDAPLDDRVRELATARRAAHSPPQRDLRRARGRACRDRISTSAITETARGDDGSGRRDRRCTSAAGARPPRLGVARSSAPRSRTTSNPAACAASSRPAPSSSASTWVRSTWSSRSSRRRPWHPAFSASAGPVTRSARSRRACCSRRIAPICCTPRWWRSGCCRARSRRSRCPRTPSTCSRSRPSPRPRSDRSTSRSGSKRCDAARRSRRCRAARSTRPSTCVSGLYPSDEFAELRPRVVWDRVAGTIAGRPGAQRLAVTSGGTIPDRGLFGVFMVGGDASHPDTLDGRRPTTGGRRVGELDEEMVYESRVGDVFALGTTSWRIEEITHDRVLVSPAFGQPGRVPFWKGDGLGRPAELGEAIGAFVRDISHPDEPDDRSRTHARLAAIGLDARAADNLIALVAEQQQSTGQVPTDTTLVVERFRDELGDWRVVLHSPYGMPVHAPWALAVAARIRDRLGVDGAAMAGDDGIVVRIPDTDADPPGAELFAFERAELEEIVTEEVGGSALFAARFRECAARALLLPRRDPGRRSPLWQQRQRASQLLDVAGATRASRSCSRRCGRCCRTSTTCRRWPR